MEKHSPTGRSPGKPNIQNIPIRTDEGRQLRESLAYALRQGLIKKGWFNKMGKFRRVP